MTSTLCVVHTPDAFFAAVDEARERKYGPIDAHRQIVQDPTGYKGLGLKCDECGRSLSGTRQRRKCNACIRDNPGTRRECVICGAIEKRSTPANRKDSDYYCPECRPEYMKMYDKSMRKKARP